MAYLKHGTPLSEIQEGCLKLSYQRHAVMLLSSITGSITHMHVIGKKNKVKCLTGALSSGFRDHSAESAGFQTAMLSNDLYTVTADGCERESTV